MRNFPSVSQTEFQLNEFSLKNNIYVGILEEESKPNNPRINLCTKLTVS